MLKFLYLVSEEYFKSNVFSLHVTELENYHRNYDSFDGGKESYGT